MTEGSCDGFQLKHWTMNVFRLDCLPFLISPSLSPLSLTPANSSRVRFSFSVLFLSFLDFRIQYQCLSFPCFQFIALAFIPQRSHSMFPILIPCRFVSSSSLFHLISLTRHLYNMSPIATFLVSGLLPFVSASVRRLLSWGF